MYQYEKSFIHYSMTLVLLEIYIIYPTTLQKYEYVHTQTLTFHLINNAGRLILAVVI